MKSDDGEPRRDDAEAAEAPFGPRPWRLEEHRPPQQYARASRLIATIVASRARASSKDRSMSPLPSLLVESIPSVAPPLALLALLCPAVLSLRTCISSKKGNDDAPSSRHLRTVLLVLFLPLVPLWLASIGDSLRFRGGVLRSLSSPSLSFYFGGEERTLPATLPPPDDGRYDEVKELLISARRNDNVDSDKASSGGGRALVTGASSGIGRAIAVQLARRGVPLILVARGGRNKNPNSDQRGLTDELDVLATDLKSCYGIAASIIRADLSIPGESRRIHEATTSANLDVRYLILAAGWGPTAQHVDLAEDGGDAVERAVRVNVESTAALSSLYGADMVRSVERESSESSSASPTHRILIVASIAGLTPGLPNSALYAATKAFGISLAQGIKLELEPRGVGVTVLCPGATRTNFASNSGMDDAALWNFPLGVVMDADVVAEEGVEAMLDGAMAYVPGLLNRLTMHVAVPLVPARVAMRFFKFCWEPWPFSFPPGWRRSKPMGGEGGRETDGAAAAAGSAASAGSEKETETGEVCGSNKRSEAAVCRARDEWKAQTDRPLEQVGSLERVLVVEETQ